MIHKRKIGRGALNCKVLSFVNVNRRLYFKGSVDGAGKYLFFNTSEFHQHTSKIWRRLDIVLSIFPSCKGLFCFNFCLMGRFYISKKFVNIYTKICIR